MAKPLHLARKQRERNAALDETMRQYERFYRLKQLQTRRDFWLPRMENPAILCLFWIRTQFQYEMTAL